MSRLIFTAAAALVSAPTASTCSSGSSSRLVPLALDVFLRNASQTRNFVSSSIKAADPSTASTSSAAHVEHSSAFAARLPSRRSLKLQRQNVHRRSKSKDPSETIKVESLAESLKAARAGPSPLDPSKQKGLLKAPNKKSEKAAGEQATSTPSMPNPKGVWSARRLRKLRRNAAFRRNRKAKAKAAEASPTIAEAAEGEEAALGEEPVVEEASSPALSAPIGVDSLQPTSESGFPLHDSETAQTLLSHNTRDKDAIAMMEKMVENVITRCLSASGSDAILEEERLRQFLSTTLASYRHLKAKRQKEKLKSDFVKKLEASEHALASAEEEVEAVPASDPLEEAFDAALSEGASDEAAVLERASSVDPDIPERDLPPHHDSVQTGVSHLELRHQHEVSSADIEIGALKPLEDIPVASLAYGLERILFNPGVHWLQDPRTKYYNYSEALQSIPDTQEFDFERLPLFMKPSSDPNLRKLLENSTQEFAGSTSSLTGALSQIYYTLNGNKPLNTQSQSFIDSPRSFSPGARIPKSIILNRTAEGKYIVDADKAMDNGPDNPLSEKGHILEKMLTNPPEEFSRFLKASKNPLKPEESRDKKEAYHFATTSGLLMRSQLDCHDDRLPRSSFDIKTRGSVALRHDMLNYVKNAGYQIIQHIGALQSFEREKYDLIRSAFLKYSMQVRIGNMDGIFLAYHSGKRIFGFEYLSLEDLDRAISGSHEESEQAFKICLGAFETILRRVTKDIPDKTLRISFEALRGGLQVFAQPYEEDLLQAEPKSSMSSDSSKPNKDPLLPEDHQTPLLLYDITFTSYLNGFQVRKGQNVDFESFEEPQTAAAPSAEPENEAEAATENSGQAPAADSREDVGEDTHVDSAPVQKPSITWSTSMDIALSTDLSLNLLRLSKLRKRQAKFTSEIMLPEGLSSSEVSRALKGFTPEQAAKAIQEAETGTAWAKGSFKARSGVSYTTRLYGIAKTVRSLAKEGRKMLAEQGQQKAGGKHQQHRKKKEKPA